MGINIDYDVNKGIIKLHQKNYIEKILTRFNITDYKPKKTLMNSKIKLKFNLK